MDHTDIERIHDALSELPMPKDYMAEMKTKDKSLVHRLWTTKEPVGLGRVMNCEDFSMLDRLL